MAVRDRIAKIVQRWFLTEPLLFSVWMTHHLVVEPRIATIRVRHGHIEYNPDFLNALNTRQLEIVLRCEAVRILLKHPYHRRKEHRELAYLASNVTLQEYLLTDLPFPSAFTLFGTHDYDREYFEFYYVKLQELVDQALSGSGSSGDKTKAPPSPDSVSGTGNTDSEKFKGEAGASGEDTLPSRQSSSEASPSGGESGQTLSEQPFDDRETEQPPIEAYADPQTSGRENTQDWDRDELLDDRITEKIRQAHESNRWGSVAGDLRERVLATLKPKLDYRLVLRHFRTSILSVSRVLTRMKPSRRYGFAYMGSRRDFATRLLFAVDVSGSIGSDDLQRGFSMVNQFFRYGVPAIDVIQFDTEVKGKPMTLKRARHALTAIGRGGTSFAPVLRYIDEHREYDGLIVFTDGYAPVPNAPQNRRTRILWIFNSEHNYRRMHQNLQPIGRSVFLKEDET